MTRELPTDRQIHHRQIESSEEEANTELLQFVADLEGCEIDELLPFWTRIDSLVADLFSDPPSEEANARVTFTYAGYRIAVEQSGDVELVKLADTTAAEQQR